MRNDKRISHIWNRYNALRGYTFQSDLPVASFLLKKTKEEFVSISNQPTEHKAYEVMLSIADTYGMNNPYPDSKAFLVLLWRCMMKILIWKWLLLL